jgi:predicted flavoprotein YhiN
VPGLYLIGEILDCDGRIGGFNFQWAWATGFLAGRAVAPCSRLITCKVAETQSPD